MPKLLVVVLVAVAVLAFVLIGLGVTREPGSADPDEHGWVGMFEVRGAPGVEVEQLLSSDCFERAQRRFRVRANFSCSTQIGPADGPIRLLRLQAVGAPPDVRIDLVPADDDGLEIDEWRPDVNDDFPLRVPVGPGGGALTIRCPGAVSDCRLLLADDR